MQEVQVTISDFIANLPAQILGLLFSLAIAAIVLLIGYRLTRRAEGWSEVIVRRAQPQDNDLLVRAIRRIIFIAGIAGTVVLALGALGVNVGALLAGLGLTSAVLAFALKDTIEQAITGVAILFQKPFRVGDVIEVEGVEGVVQDIAIRTTNIKTFDGLQVLIPNNRIYQGIIRNKSFYGTRRAMVTLGIAYENDLASAHASISAAVKRTPGVVADPAPTVAFEAFDANSIRAVIRYWYEPASTDSLVLQTAVTESILASTAQQGIRIPQPAAAVVVRAPDAGADDRPAPAGLGDGAAITPAGPR